MCGSQFLQTGQLNVYFCIKRKVSEICGVNGLKFLFEKYDSVLGDFITRMEVRNFFISHLFSAHKLICHNSNQFSQHLSQETLS
jgi:hypothetical protein